MGMRIDVVEGGKIAVLALRANRLGLLQQTLSLFYRIADISKLGGTA